MLLRVLVTIYVVATSATASLGQLERTGREHQEVEQSEAMYDRFMGDHSPIAEIVARLCGALTNAKASKEVIEELKDGYSLFYGSRPTLAFIDNYAYCTVVSSLNHGIATSLFQTVILGTQSKKSLLVFLDDESVQKAINYRTLGRFEMNYMDWVSGAEIRFSEPISGVKEKKRKRVLKNLRMVKARLIELGASCRYYMC